MDKQELETEAKELFIRFKERFHRFFLYIKSKIIKHKKKSITVGVLSFAFVTFYPSYYKSPLHKDAGKSIIIRK